MDTKKLSNAALRIQTSLCYVVTIILMVFSAQKEWWWLTIISAFGLYGSILLTRTIESMITDSQKLDDLRFRAVEYNSEFRRVYQNFGIIRSLNQIIEDCHSGNDDMSPDGINDAIEKLTDIGSDTIDRVETMRLWAAHDANMNALQCVDIVEDEFRQLRDEIDKTRAKHNEMLLLELEANGIDHELLEKLREEAADAFLMYADYTSAGQDDDDDD